MKLTRKTTTAEEVALTADETETSNKVASVLVDSMLDMVDMVTVATVTTTLVDMMTGMMDMVADVSAGTAVGMSADTVADMSAGMLDHVDLMNLAMRMVAGIVVEILAAITMREGAIEVVVTNRRHNIQHSEPCDSAGQCWPQQGRLVDVQPTTLRLITP